MTKASAPNGTEEPSPDSIRTEDLDQLVEALADLVHDIWIAWMVHLLRQCRTDPYNGEEVIPVDAVVRWYHQMNTPYPCLPDEMKQSDRTIALKILARLGLRTEE